ncbi:hypothetical protein PG996_000303 [Apiospora saccharicola]|uniref:Erythromycin esterase n=1 Tax=Apiospora saccharicola TaxID=335842 RepID=A0ABR1WDJ7_9PEZI
MARTRRSARLASASTVSCLITNPPYAVQFTVAAATKLASSRALTVCEQVADAYALIQNVDRASATPRLGSVAEGQEETVVERSTPNIETIKSSPPKLKPSTPSRSTPVKLPKSEMHPSKFHQTMAPPSSGLRHGFVDINPDPKAAGGTQSTPSKTPMSSGFTFRVSRPSIAGGEQDSGLGPEAKRMMEELREEASKIKAELAAKREQEREEEAVDGRKYAKAKGKASRYSDVHMAEFKKMDSIENHHSTFRYTPGRATPAKNLKRTQSKANLDESSDAPAAASSSTRKAPMSVKRALVKPTEKHHQPEEAVEAPVKRVRQRKEDDASTQRPISRDGSSIPAPKTLGSESVRRAIPRAQSFANLLTPTKASAARTALPKTPTVSMIKSPSKTDIRSLARSPSKPELTSALARSPSKSSLVQPNSSKALGGLTKSVTISSIPAPQAIPKLVQTPGRFDRVKSILKRQFSSSKPKSSLPQLAGAAPKTPGRTEKPEPVAPMTTPARQYDRHVEFTPDTKQAAMTQNSPSPVKSVLPRPKSVSKPPAVQFPSLNAVMSAKKSGSTAVSYPDLSAYKEEENSSEDEQASLHEALPESQPGTFTFRSDHTIRFGSTSPNGFGGSPGQSTLRQVRASFAPSASMPGGFPDDRESQSPSRKANKENADPELIAGIPHGMSNKKRSRAMWEDEEIKTGVPHGISNKKRHRASSDEEEDEEIVQRTTKKLRKNPPSMAPRFACSSPIKKPSGSLGTPSPQKKSGISLSRLNMLARPKVRK